MSKRDPSLYLLDIFIAHNKIERYTDRELEIIGEATNKLINAGVVSDKNRRIVDFRNEIAHGYFGINAEIVFDVCKNKLPQYINELKHLRLEEIQNGIKMLKEEYAKNPHIVKLLETLKKEFE